MTDETRDKISKYLDLINYKKGFFFPHEIDWGELTEGFEEDAMTELLSNIHDDCNFKFAISGISMAWENSMKHFDPICYHSVDYDFYPRPKYDENYTIDYVLKKIENRRTLHRSLEFHKEQSETEESVCSHKNESNTNEQMEKLQDRIKELEAENKELREKQTILEETDELEEKEQEDVLYNKVSFECFLRLLEKSGFDMNNTGNKSRAGELWHMLTGKSEADLRKFCSSRAYINNHTKEDIKRLNDKLKEMGILEIEL